MNVLVTGANGFIGSNLCEALTQSGLSVTGLVRNSSDLRFLVNEDRIKIVKGDITVRESLANAVQDKSVVFHVAGLASDWGPLDIFREVNVEGVRNVMDCALQAGVERVVHISSVSVYGFPGGTDIDEKSPLVARPQDTYITTKTEGEKLALNYNSREMAVTAIRPAGVYGPNDRTTTLQLLPAILSGQFGYVNGGRHIMAPVYIDNLIQMIKLVAESDKAPGQVYNATDDGKTTWKEYVEWMCEDLGCKKPRLSIPNWIAWPLALILERTAKLFNKKESPMINTYRIRAVMQDNHYSTQKAKSELGYRPEITTREGIRRTIRWYLDYTSSNRS